MSFGYNPNNNHHHPTLAPPNLVTSTTRSITERIQIQFEIWFESITDALAATSESIRRPLLILACFAVFLTLRSARSGVNKMKDKGYQPHDLPNYRSGTVYGGVVGSGNNGRFGSTSSVGGGAMGGAPPLRLGGDAPPPLGSNGAGAGGGAMGMMGGSSGAASRVTSATSSNRGMMGGMMGGGGGTAPKTVPIRANSVTTSQVGTATADLVDNHGTNVQVVDPSLLRDYGDIVTGFFGTIETVQAYESPSTVEQVLAGPGANKVLVIDGGGNVAHAIFDSSLASLAQRNGWRGVIINGAVRNAHALAGIPIGIKAVGATPVKGRRTTGTRSVPLNIGGVQFNPGWFVYADKDGVLVSQRDLGVTLMVGGPTSTTNFNTQGMTTTGTTSATATTNSMGGMMGGPRTTTNTSPMGGANGMAGSPMGGVSAGSPAGGAMGVPPPGRIGSIQSTAGTYGSRTSGITSTTIGNSPYGPRTSSAYARKESRKCWIELVTWASFVIIPLFLVT